MSRGPRVYCDSGIYHIMFRGSNKQDIFHSKNDYIKFLDLLQTLKSKKNFEIHAYCLMTNHVHLVVKEAELGDISDIMKRLIGEYTQWFNYKYERSGSLMESRYKSKTVDTDEYFMHLVRYIHQNPLKAMLVSNIKEYPWSSYCSYLNKESVLVNTDFLFCLLPESNYEGFHEENETNDFALYHDECDNDNEVIWAIKRLGIDDPKSLRYMPEEVWGPVVNELKEEFSLRRIEKVTGISRYKIKNA